MKRSIALCGAHRIGEGGEPLIGAAVGGDDDGAGAVALDGNFVPVAALDEIYGVEAEVIENEQIDP